MQPNHSTSLPAFRLGSPSPSAEALALAVHHNAIDWSGVLGGTIRLPGREWDAQTAPAGSTALVDGGGDWLLVVPVSPIPGPYRPEPAGLGGPLSGGRIALATWLLLAAVQAGDLPDVLLVAEGPAPSATFTEVRFTALPRNYRFAAGYFEPAGAWTQGNTAFTAATGYPEATPGSLPWFDALRLPCAAVALGTPGGADEAVVTWQDLGRNASQLAAVAHALDGGFWPRGEATMIALEELDACTPAAEQEEKGAAVAAARRGLWPWMTDAPTGGGTLPSEAARWENRSDG